MPSVQAGVPNIQQKWEAKAAFHMEQAQKDLDSATAAVLQAQKRLTEAQATQDEAALQMAIAEQEYQEVGRAALPSA